MSISVNSKTKLLFIGDSITDAGRNDEPEQIGHGFVRVIRDYLFAKDPANAPQVINRGISGNKVTDLQRRWQTDVLDLSPDIVSVFIGINDVWHGLHPEWGPGVLIDQYVPVYRSILKQLHDALPKCAIVLCEPSVIWAPAPEQGNQMLKPYVKAVHELAKEFKVAAFVPLHQAFEKARELRPDIGWAPDGVHPASPGSMLIARNWLDCTGLL